MPLVISQVPPWPHRSPPHALCQADHSGARSDAAPPSATLLPPCLPASLLFFGQHCHSASPPVRCVAWQVVHSFRDSQSYAACLPGRPSPSPLPTAPSPSPTGPSSCASSTSQASSHAASSVIPGAVRPVPHAHGPLQRSVALKHTPLAEERCAGRGAAGCACVHSRLLAQLGGLGQMWKSPLWQ